MEITLIIASLIFFICVEEVILISNAVRGTHFHEFIDKEIFFENPRRGVHIIVSIDGRPDLPHWLRLEQRVRNKSLFICYNQLQTVFWFISLTDEVKVLIQNSANFPLSNKLAKLFHIQQQVTWYLFIRLSNFLLIIQDTCGVILLAITKIDFCFEEGRQLASSSQLAT